MTAEPLETPVAPDAASTTGKVRVERRRLSVRITHWVNVIAVFLLLFSGLQIFNAHPALYWGQASTFADPWLSMKAEPVGADLRGITRIGNLKLDTTGLLGRSKHNGVWENRGFPAWATIPPRRHLAVGRTWHFFFAWVFAINGLVYLVTGLLNRHLIRDVVPSGEDLRTLHKDPHLRLKFSRGPGAARYHQVQKIAYSTMIFIVLPLIALTGMTMSPALDAAFPFLLDIFGGRQSARSVHFICMALIVAFVIVHLFMVLLSGPITQIRGMITGKVAIENDKEQP